MLKAISTITNALGALNYKGTWNASSNTPTLVDGTGAKGDYYVVSTAGTQTFGGVQLFFGTGDWIAYNGAVWQRVEGGSDGNFANVTLTSTDAGASASPLLELYRDSASPAASDTLGEIEFNGEDSAGNKQAYGLIHASILSPTSTAEQGQLHFETATAGALTEKMIIGTTNLVINEIGAVFNVRIEGDTDANLFYTDATNSRVGVGLTNPTEKFQVVGNIKLSGNVIPASGFGIDFSATSHPAGMTSELLADYEEGTWTPTLTTDGTNFTSVGYSAQNGCNYIKIGKSVLVHGTLFANAVTVGGATGNVMIGGLPFANMTGGLGGPSNSAGSVGNTLGWTVNAPMGLLTEYGGSKLYLTKVDSFGVVTNIGVANVAAGNNFVAFSLTYQVD
jgi:hypothetical protein